MQRAVLLLSFSIANLTHLTFKFVRIADDTTDRKLSQLFMDIWKLKKPDLALSFYGSIPPNKSFQKRFFNMLLGVFQKTCKSLLL